METARRTALITGGAQGLGKEIAQNLIRHDLYVIVLDIQKFDILPRAYREKITDYFEIDLANLGAVNTLVDELLRKYPRIDVLINNAALRVFKNFCEFNELEIERYVNVNFRTPILLTMKVYPFMKKNGYGRIMNISSVSAFSGYSLGSMYCSTKCALNTFTESVGKEIKSTDKVTINAICPDSFATVKGEPMYNSKQLVESINKTIDDLLNSNRNGEIIVIARKKTVFLNLLNELRKRVSWLVRN